MAGVSKMLTVGAISGVGLVFLLLFVCLFVLLGVWGGLIGFCFVLFYF